MKRICIILSLTLMCLFFCCPLTCFALDFDPRQIHLEYQNAPNGTAYIDVLARISETDDSWTAFNVAPSRLVDKSNVSGNTEFIYETLNINENSDIAKYNEDGFVSLTIHSKEIKEFQILKAYGYEADLLILDCFADDLYEKYDNFKIAYVNKNGNILKVIGVVDRDYSASESYALIVNDDKAVYRSFGTSPVIGILIFIIPVVFFTFIVILSIFLIIKKLHNNRIIRHISNSEQAK